LADSTGTLQTQYTFEPFGNTSVTGTATTNSFAYTGRELDTTGLYFYRARYYSAGLTRFLSEDPIEFAGGTNLYSYAANDPLDFRDPLGTDKNKKDFGKCLKQNAHLYSAVGIVDLVTGSVAPYLGLEGTDLSESAAGNVLGGNDVTGLAFVFVGDPENAPESIGAVISTSVEKGIPLGVGNQLFIGGNSPNHIQRLFPRVGRPPQALARSAGLTKALKLAEKAAEWKALLDLGLAGALALDCSLGLI